MKPTNLSLFSARDYNPNGSMVHLTAIWSPRPVAVFSFDRDVSGYIIKSMSSEMPKVQINILRELLFDNGKTYLLFHQRLKEPFYGYFGFINGKIRFGDTSQETAQREFKEETGLTGRPVNICVYHKLRGPSKHEILLDNFFFVYVMKNVKGNLRDSIDGKNFWYTPREAKKLKKYTGMEELIQIVLKEKNVPYFEKYFKEDKI